MNIFITILLLHWLLITFTNYYKVFRTKFYNDKFDSGVYFVGGISGYLGFTLGGHLWKQKWLSDLWWLPLVTDYIVFPAILTFYNYVCKNIQKSKQSK